MTTQTQTVDYPLPPASPATFLMLKKILTQTLNYTGNITENTSLMEFFRFAFEHKMPFGKRGIERLNGSGDNIISLVDDSINVGLGVSPFYHYISNALTLPLKNFNDAAKYTQSLINEMIGKPATQM